MADWAGLPPVSWMHAQPLKLPVKGYGILYRYGLFRQQFEHGFQKEHPDVWMEEGYPFTIRHEEDAVRGSFC